MSLSSLSAHIDLCCMQFGLRISLNSLLYTMHFLWAMQNLWTGKLKNIITNLPQHQIVHYMDRMLSFRISEHACYYSYSKYGH